MRKTPASVVMGSPDSVVIICGTETDGEVTLFNAVEKRLSGESGRCVRPVTGPCVTTSVVKRLAAFILLIRHACRHCDTKATDEVPKSSGTTFAHRLLLRPKQRELQPFGGFALRPGQHIGIPCQDRLRFVAKLAGDDVNRDSALQHLGSGCVPQIMKMQ